MKITSVKFKRSIVDINQYHNNDSIFPEYAFFGRSNVGKSSLINYIVNKNVANVSSYLGSTRYINFFLINNKWYLIDLPGYGYSSRRKIDVDNIKKLVDNYIFFRKKTISLFLLIDSRLFIQKNDFDLIKKLNNKKINFCVVFTKIDKISSLTVDKNIFCYINEIKKNKLSIPIWFKVSVKKKYGRKNIIRYMEEQLLVYKQKLIIPSS
ncbi:ribosome biogenesis GTP-binding protein YihA/YsxC [Blattabacterium cuenoti]|uniref:ribosome biogenesis GTP-binding protein YihA/YsxC n=1 Tax=Blattabacterium cuenoti TaxID=1653831 RepID=UPI00163C5557|nr:ribosome biogenesis GTP-binding protein YihA/YsxC [Blattabacterium cuenoti]